MTSRRECSDVPLCKVRLIHETSVGVNCVPKRERSHNSVLIVYIVIIMTDLLNIYKLYT